MYAAVPRMMPACVIAGAVIVGDLRASRRAQAPAGSSALARPKSSTFTVPSGAHLHVGGFQVAVDDALLVRGLERFRDLLRDRQGLVNRNRALGDALRERRPLDQLHDQRATPFDSSRPWIAAMLGWLSEARTCASRWKRAMPLGIVRRTLGQNLDRDVAFKLRVARAIHLPHAARADLTVIS